MVNKVKTDTELQAWDIYFAAALEQVKHHITSGVSTAAQWDLQAKHAADLADRMLLARRLRA